VGCRKSGVRRCGRSPLLAPKINRFTLVGEQVRYDQEELISTPSSTTELTAKVTEVLS
jgi:hypothetical protein